MYLRRRCRTRNRYEDESMWNAESKSKYEYRTQQSVIVCLFFFYLDISFGVNKLWGVHKTSKDDLHIKTKTPFTQRRWDWQTVSSLRKCIYVPRYITPEKCEKALNNHPSFWICVYRKLITNNVFEKLRFQNVFRPHKNAKPAFLNSSVLPKSLFEKLRFRDGLL